MKTSTKTRNRTTTLEEPNADLYKSPPKGASARALSWYNATKKAYGIRDQDGLLTLYTIVQHLDRADRAAALIVKHGELVVGAQGGLRANPACAIERDARRAMIAALKHLDILDAAPKNRPGRPEKGVR